jgi:hypothetical protein
MRGMITFFIDARRVQRHDLFGASVDAQAAAFANVLVDGYDRHGPASFFRRGRLQPYRATYPLSYAAQAGLSMPYESKNGAAVEKSAPRARIRGRCFLFAQNVNAPVNRASKQEDVGFLKNAWYNNKYEMI